MKRHKPIKIQTPIKVVVKEEAEKKNQKWTTRRAKDQYFIDWKTDCYVLVGQSLSILILRHCSSALPYLCSHALFFLPFTVKVVSVFNMNKALSSQPKNCKQLTSGSKGQCMVLKHVRWGIKQCWAVQNHCTIHHGLVDTATWVRPL